MPDNIKELEETIARTRVISEERAAEIAGLSLIHFRRMRRGRRGPPYVQLSERRIGYRMGDLIDWLEARVTYPRDAA